MKEEAFAVADRVRKDFPDSPDAIVLTGTLYERLGNTAEALQWWETCVRQFPHRADVLHAMGWVALRKGEHEKALSLWRKALAVRPRMRGLHGGAARALLSVGKTEEAVAELQAEIRISPGDCMAHYLLGEAYVQLKQYDQARQSYLATVEIDPEFKHAYYGLGVACARLGQPEQARQYREEFKNLSSESLDELIDESVSFEDVAAVGRTLAKTLTEAGQLYAAHRFLWKAEQHWRRAAEVDAKHAPCRMALAEMYLRLGRYRESLEMCRQLAIIDADCAVYRLNAGIVHDRLGQFDAAERALREAVRLDPRSAETHRELAGLLLKIDRGLPEAKTLAAAAVRLEPTATNYLLLSEACRKGGDLNEALEAAERAIELEPHNAVCRRARDLLAQGLVRE
ncbi:MAG: tetratricopeptide repeat protein [Pirellulales bacterium]|nr:tetratricopeptide repeat protein [Pirellulales bacterium]